MLTFGDMECVGGQYKSDMLTQRMGWGVSGSGLHKLFLLAEQVYTWQCVSGVCYQKKSFMFPPLGALLFNNLMKPVCVVIGWWPHCTRTVYCTLTVHTINLHSALQVLHRLPCLFNEDFQKPNYKYFPFKVLINIITTFVLL